ncbi:MFS family permease [Pseudarthrobacter siccitolerans]|uniref:MFS family permease n=1 Tax=Pseudarthrobacter siccitolerans TaxID=861266 RepID=A0ABU0PJQ0_9MICC|nr:MFS transporter [Pseudarthrobacter siccitolerans]MDQ0674193.1 MFS family permease [Pseudarthrobacter siccitolerans]
MAVKTITGDSAGLPARGTSSSNTAKSAPALGAPTSTPRAYVVGMPIASAGLWMAVLAPALVVLAIKVSEITTPETRAGALSLVAGVGALIALLANPLFGRLSDRTTSRFGMRKPWIVGGSIVGMGSLILLGSATDVAGVLVAWVLAQLSFNAALAALVATLPDQTAPAERGRLSGLIGMTLPVGLVAAAYFAQLFDNAFQMAVVPGAVGTAVAIAFAFTFKDRVLTEKPAPLSLKEIGGSFYFNPRTYPGLGWAWFTKFLVYIGYCAGLLYLPYFFADHLRVAETEVASLVFQATLVSSLGTVITSLAGGWISDKIGKRKGMVVASAIIMMAGLIVIATSTTTDQVLVGQAIAGLGLGCFGAVDVALIADLLPGSQSENAKTFGVFNIAQALPQSLVPALAFPVITLGGYPALFIGGAVVGIIGAVLVTRIKGVK